MRSSTASTSTTASSLSPFTESFRTRQGKWNQVQRLLKAASSLSSTPVTLEETAPVIGRPRVAAGSIIRPLLLSEQTTLLSCQNQCTDWTKIRLWLVLAIQELNDCQNGGEEVVLLQQEQHDMSPWLQEHVSFNRFEGMVTIRVDLNHTTTTTTSSSSSLPNSLTLIPPGIHHNTLIYNCIFDRHCRVYRNTILQNTFVGAHATVMNNGRMTASAGTSSSSTTPPGSHCVDELSISVGPETGGGRRLNVSVESTMIDICQQMGMSRRVCTTTTTPYTSSLLHHGYNVIGEEAVVRDTPTVHNVYMACHSSIEAATCVENTTLLSTSMIGHASTAQNTLLQWHASILHQSHVADTLLMEHAHAGPHSIVSHSILGPDVHVSAGEVHASLLGPNTNAHHQSLLISVLWPLGRGNVGYGANVGSNHTGRIPDQEILVPEGMFWGLSSVIKFPMNLSSSPYTLIAAGTILSPQQQDDVHMPFSLIVNDAATTTTATSNTSIIPGWVLHHSPYTISRSEQKFASRRKAKRHDFYTGWNIIRPSMIQLCWMARQELLTLSSPQGEENDKMKTATRPMMIGNMILSEKARLTGIMAYTNMIRRYALLGLLHQLQQQQQHETDWVDMEFNPAMPANTTTSATLFHEIDLTQPQWTILPWEEETNTWTLQKGILLHEYPRHVHNNKMSTTAATAATKSTTTTCSCMISTHGWIMNLLQNELIPLEQEYAQRVFKCKQRDDVRGKDTIPDYITSHVTASDDAVVQAAQQHAMKVQEDVETIIACQTLQSKQQGKDGTTMTTTTINPATTRTTSPTISRSKL